MTLQIQRKKCIRCGSTEDLQEHHISYVPEIKINLCVGCHNKEHIGHGVGRGAGFSRPELTEIEIKKFTRMWTNGIHTYADIMEEFKISIGTVYNRSKTLGLGKRVRIKTLKIGKNITLPEDLLKWARQVAEDNVFPGVRNVSGLCEKALTDLRKKMEAQK
ncbi:unnamed protein product [marine sediment metagenome]|uniref:Uncharacterized protein n=1 Tax=marine sediment metagenome TaxID=412755 RepID=X1NG94_9ZZZZ